MFDRGQFMGNGTGYWRNLEALNSWHYLEWQYQPIDNRLPTVWWQNTPWKIQDFVGQSEKFDSEPHELIFFVAF